MKVFAVAIMMTFICTSIGYGGEERKNYRSSDYLSDRVTSDYWSDRVTSPTVRGSRERESPSGDYVGSNPYDGSSTANPYGAGNRYHGDGINNPYGGGNKYSPDSWKNPYATQSDIRIRDRD